MAPERHVSEAFPDVLGAYQKPVVQQKIGALGCCLVVALAFPDLIVPHGEIVSQKTLGAGIGLPAFHLASSLSLECVSQHPGRQRQLSVHLIRVSFVQQIAEA